MNTHSTTRVLPFTAADLIQHKRYSSMNQAIDILGIDLWCSLSASEQEFICAFLRYSADSPEISEIDRNRYVLGMFPTC